LLTVPSRPTTLSRFSNLRRKSDLSAAGMMPHKLHRGDSLQQDCCRGMSGLALS
jgi:hypothetical protein